VRSRFPSTGMGGGGTNSVADRSPNRFRSFLASRATAAFVAGGLVVIFAQALVQYTSLPSLLVRPLLLPDTPGPSEAIVVLGAGINQTCLPNFHSVRRTTFAARFFKEGRAPIVLFTGGVTSGGPCAVADVMAGLARDMGVPAGAILIERSSGTTWENATEASKILRERGIRRILLVTDSLHMRRGEACFRRLGFEVGRASVPTADAYCDGLDLLTDALHELGGLWYYRLRGRF
jgi:uncharacterized SAM-binding protein YcdF (DUF218 family)